jgi:hypothetical protein
MDIFQRLVGYNAGNGTTIDAEPLFSVRHHTAALAQPQANSIFH